MRILGQYDTSGNYIAYTQALEAFPCGNRLCDEDGFTLGVKDQYGDWVSANMMSLGLKCKLDVDSDEAPYCSYGHKTKASCDCGQIASNE